VSGVGNPKRKLEQNLHHGGKNLRSKSQKRKRARKVPTGEIGALRENSSIRLWRERRPIKGRIKNKGWEHWKMLSSMTSGWG